MTKKQVIKYLKDNKMNIQSANACLFICDLVFDSYVNSYITNRVNFSPVFCYISYKHLRYFFQIIPQKHIDKIAKKNYMDYLKNPNSLTKKIKKHKDLEKQLDNLWKNYQKKKNFLDEKDLLFIYKSMVKIAQEWWYYGAVLEGKGEIINLEVMPKFAKRHNLDSDKVREMLNVLSHPETQSVLNTERKDFLDICLYISGNKKLREDLAQNKFEQILKDKKSSQKIKSYIKKYFWFRTDFYKATETTPKLLLKKVLSEISKNKRPQVLKELKEIDNNFRKINKQKNKLLSTLKLTKGDKKEIRFSRLIIGWLDQRKVGTMKQCYYFFSIIGETAKKYNLKYHDLAIYIIDEFGKFLAKKEKIKKKDIIGRNDGVFVVFERNKKVKMFYGRTGKEMFNIATYLKKQKEVRGQVASRGSIKKIKGKVRVVYNPTKDKFNKGEILVTSMTRVEFVPLMRKAKAIITNEGGVACHAAIVSREMGLPCIIGTRVATDVLKTGDRVELDLMTGQIKILR